MRVRKRRAALIETRFIEIPDAALILVRELAEAHTDVTGAFIKVQPTIRASERSTLDVKLIRQRYLDAGAAAVVVTPIVIPDSRQGVLAPVSALERHTPEEYLRAWFENAMASPEVIERAIADALGSMSEAGL